MYPKCAFSLTLHNHPKGERERERDGYIYFWGFCFASNFVNCACDAHRFQVCEIYWIFFRLFVCVVIFNENFLNSINLQVEANISIEPIKNMNNPSSLGGNIQSN